MSTCQDKLIFEGDGGSIKGGERPPREAFQARADVYHGDGEGDVSRRRQDDHYLGFMLKTEVGRTKATRGTEGQTTAT